MAAGQLHFEAIEARIAAIETINRQRALTSAETVELSNLFYRRRLQLHRLDRQIKAMRGKLQRLEAIRERTVA